MWNNSNRLVHEIEAEYAYSTGDGLSSVLDLALIGAADGTLRTLDLTDPYNPQIIGTVVDDSGQEITSWVQDIAINADAGLAFVTTYSSIQIIDINDPFNPLLLHTIIELPDENGNMVPIGQVPAIVEKDGWVYMANTVDGMRVLDLDPVYLEQYCYDGEFPEVSQTFCSDYYPALGEKEILLLGRDYTWEGLLDAPAKAIVKNVRVIDNLFSKPLSGTSSVSTDDYTLSIESKGESEAVKATFHKGIARFYLKKTGILKSRYIEVTFEIDPSSISDSRNLKDFYKGNSFRKVITFEVRDNANVTLEQVKNGDAVFVADYFENDRKSKGVYPSDKKPEEIEDNDKKFIFVQELLNQVVSRKRSIADYSLITENGLFGTEAVSALAAFRNNFDIGNTQVSFINNPDGTVTYNPLPLILDNTSPIFRKMSKDYGIRQQGMDKTGAWLRKIIDKETLVGTTEKLYGNASDPDVTIGGDTGLYELYQNVVKRFVDGMITEGERYANYTGVEWFDRGAKDTTATKRTGVSYSYGGKQTLDKYEKTVVTQCVTPASDTTKSKITLWYKDDNGVVLTAQFGGRVVSTVVPTGYNGVSETATTCTSEISGSKLYPGLYKNELRSYNKGNKKQKRYMDAALTQAYPAYPQFKASKWAGIDCMGLVLRSIESSDDKLNFIELPSVTISAKDNIVDRIGSKNGLGWIATGEFNKEGGLFDGAAYNWIDKDSDKGAKWIKKGDVVLYEGHISIVYSERWGESQKSGDYDIIHAFGYEKTNNEKLNKKFPWYRKVGITAGNHPGLSEPEGFGRIKLWD